MPNYTEQLITYLKCRLPNLEVNTEVSYKLLKEHSIRRRTVTLPYYIRDIEEVLIQLLVDSIVYESTNEGCNTLFLPSEEYFAVEIYLDKGEKTVECRYLLQK